MISEKARLPFPIFFYNLVYFHSFLVIRDLHCTDGFFIIYFVSTFDGSLALIGLLLNFDKIMFAESI
jgi:hypothetical protein